MPDDTRAQTEELAEAIRYLQRLRDRPDIDADLADQLQAAIDTALRVGSDGVVDQVQSTVGLTHISIRQHIAQNTDMVAGMREDLHAWRQDQETIAETTQRVVQRLEQSLTTREAADASHIGAIQEVTAAVTQLRSEFHNEFSKVGERLTGVEATVGEHAGEIHQIKDVLAGFRQTRDDSIEERRQHARQLRESAEEHVRLDRRDTDLAQQLSELSAQQQETQRLLADVLARLPPVEEQ